MPPALALLLSFGLTAAFVWQDSRQRPRVSGAVWIPTVWIMILSSRSVSQWLNPGAGLESADELLEGSPTDRIVYLTLIVAACLALRKRGIAWRELYWRNTWLTLFLCYCAVSSLWSDFPLVSFRRWSKGLGDLLMALILLSDRHPAKAVETTIKRCAYLHIPLSIVLIKYLPHLGSSHSRWTGAAYYGGVTNNKNMLGYLLFVFGLFFLCSLLAKVRRARAPDRLTNTGVILLLLMMIIWLFGMADSKTPLLALIAGSLVAFGLRFEMVRQRFSMYLVTGILTGILALTLNLQSSVLESAGRDATLTGRTELWESVLKMTVNPWIGAGFESFWLGKRLEELESDYAFRPTQAHNGYVEMYLNLGWLGLFLFGGVLCGAYATVRKRLVRLEKPGTTRSDVTVSTFSAAFLCAYLLYNVTEATFKSLNFLFVIFLFVAIEYPRSVGRELDVGGNVRTVAWSGRGMRSIQTSGVHAGQETQDPRSA
jgi:exopolysaccharide production protein ExoQ